jgi:hypothetical protein
VEEEDDEFGLPKKEVIREGASHAALLFWSRASLRAPKRRSPALVFS